MFDAESDARHAQKRREEWIAEFTRRNRRTTQLICLGSVVINACALVVAVLVGSEFMAGLTLMGLLYAFLFLMMSGVS